MYLFCFYVHTINKYGFRFLICIKITFIYLVQYSNSTKSFFKNNYDHNLKFGLTANNLLYLLYLFGKFNLKILRLLKIQRNSIHFKFVHSLLFYSTILQNLTFGKQSYSKINKLFKKYFYFYFIFYKKMSLYAQTITAI